jgi:ATP-binding cassette subfamily F protein 3
MILLAVHNVTKHFGPEPVLAGVTFEVRPGERVGLVGPNGCGKTTLLKIIAGREEADSGGVQLHASARLGYLEQQPDFAAGGTVWDEAKAALGELLALANEAEDVASALADAADEGERRRLGARLDRLHQLLHQSSGYHVDHRIERVLHGLGFANETFQQPAVQLSGGQQNRLLLARLLLSDPDLMLLDEPSNHLDLEATQWLEEFLAQSRQALVVVSHDRYFLDKVAGRTFELFDGTVDAYAGNFSAYWKQKEERLVVERRTWERQREEIARMEDFIRRNHYGQKSAQAEDRRKKLARIERVERPREIVPPPMGFPPADRTGDVVVRVERLAKAYDRPLFSNLTVDVCRGERWGILGPNGSGKTTLLRCLVGEERPDDGRVILGAGARIGYFDQRLSFPDPKEPILDAVRPPHKEFVERQRRDVLARFGLVGNIVHQPPSALSGGERNRAALARLAASDANLLILDEPTNHLDLWARDALERALRRFDGTAVLVSHDRYFLNQVVDHLLVVEGDRFRVIEGNYDTYQHLVRVGLAGEREREPADPAGSASQNRDGGPAPADDAAPRQKPKRKFPHRKLEDLEAEIFQRETRVADLHELLASPDVLRDGERVKETKAELVEQQQALALLYEHWEDAAQR